MTTLLVPARPPTLSGDGGSLVGGEAGGPRMAGGADRLQLAQGEVEEVRTGLR